MSIISRISGATKAKLNQILDNAEDLHETFDYAFERLTGLLNDAHTLIEGILALQHRLELQASRMNRTLPDLHSEALDAVAAGDEDAARRALQLQQASLLVVETLHQKIIQLELQEEKLASTATIAMTELTSLQSGLQDSQPRPNHSPEEEDQLRSVTARMQQIEEELSPVLKEAKDAVRYIDAPKTPENFTDRDVDRIIKDLAPLSIARSIEDHLDYLKSLNPAP